MGSIGIAVQQGISFHGLALNVNVSTEPFSWIHPCGLRGVEMTSMKTVLSRKLSMEDIRKSMCRHLEEVFNIKLEAVRPDQIREITDLS
jgi:lipoate-protein ligase B